MNLDSQSFLDMLIPSLRLVVRMRNGLFVGVYCNARRPRRVRGVGGWGASFRWRLDDGWEEGAEEDWAGGPWWGQVSWGTGWWWWGWYCTCGGKKKVEKDGSKDQRGRTESCADGAVIMTIQVSCQSVRPEKYFYNISKISRRRLNSFGVPGLF